MRSNSVSKSSVLGKKISFERKVLLELCIFTAIMIEVKSLPRGLSRINLVKVNVHNLGIQFGGVLSTSHVANSFIGTGFIPAALERVFTLSAMMISPQLKAIPHTTTQHTHTHTPSVTSLLVHAHVLRNMSSRVDSILTAFISLSLVSPGMHKRRRRRRRLSQEIQIKYNNHSKVFPPSSSPPKIRRVHTGDDAHSLAPEIGSNCGIGVYEETGESADVVQTQNYFVILSSLPFSVSVLDPNSRSYVQSITRACSESVRRKVNNVRSCSSALNVKSTSRITWRIWSTIRGHARPTNLLP